jgi:hypothetical protein
MGILQNIRARLPKKHATPHNRADSEETLVPSPDSRRKAQSLKTRGKAIAAFVREKLAYVISSDADTRGVRASTFRDRYVPVRHLGSGGNGEVTLHRDTRIGTLVAVKTVYHDVPKTIPREASILRVLGRHENIVGYYTMLPHPTEHWRIQIVLEYCLYGDLVDYVSTFSGPCPELFLWYIFKHIASGLSFLHQRGIVHGDIKPANILLTTPLPGEAYPLPKLGDFGSSALNPPHDIPRAHIGTLGFQPPEAASRHGPEADIWALGCVIHECALGRLPLHNLEEPDLHADEWFEGSGLRVPCGTVNHRIYKEMCMFMAFHPPLRTRIDPPIEEGRTVYSKLLNYLMMRALDLNLYTRIAARELHNMLPVLEPVVQYVLQKGEGGLLEWIDELRGGDQCITDSQVFARIFDGMALQADQDQDLEFLERALPLLRLVQPEDQVVAYQFAAELEVLNAF